MVTPLRPGARVVLDDTDPDAERGTVRAPSERQRMIGEAELRDDLPDAVLVRWDTGALRWEYAADLHPAG